MRYLFWKVCWIVVVVLLINQFFLIKESDSFLVVLYIILSIVFLYIKYSYQQPRILFYIEEKSRFLYILTKIIGYTLVSSLVLLYINYFK